MSCAARNRALLLLFEKSVGNRTLFSATIGPPCIINSVAKRLHIAFPSGRIAASSLLHTDSTIGPFLFSRSFLDVLTITGEENLKVCPVVKKQPISGAARGV